MFGDILQPTHLVFILVVALVVLGPKRLPEVGRSLGKSLRDFKGAMAGIEQESRDIFDTKTDSTPQRHQPEPVMATASSSDEPALAGAATQESPAVAPPGRRLELSSALAAAETAALVALLREPGGPRPSTAQIAAAGGPRALLIATAGLFSEPAEQRAAEELDGWRRQGITAVSYACPGYPPGLQDLQDPPPLLFLTGELAAVDSGGVAVIGTRRPSSEGVRRATDVAAAVARSGRTVISGLAAGIDTAAHLAALGAAGRSIAVLGNGLGHVYPPANAGLQRRLSAVVSQFWPEQPPSRASFPLRNAVMSGISRATVIIEAGERSGTRIQARCALAQGRELFLMRGLLAQEWARTLAQQARVRVIDAPEELLEALDDC